MPDALTVGLGLGTCRRGGGGMAYAMEYCRLDGEDEGLGGSGAPAALRKTRVLAWQGRRWALKKRMA